MALVRRIFWGRLQGRVILTFRSRFIIKQSVVIVTASEGDEGITSESPQRFVGLAPIGVDNIAPFNGGVVFRIYVLWDEALPIWTDIFIADELPQGFIRADGIPPPP
jgi:hypothetical protein